MAEDNIYGYYRDVNLIDGVLETSQAFSSASNSDFKIGAASGDLTGVSAINKFGANSNILDGTTEDVWDGGGTYVFPITADITHISTTINDATMVGKVVEVQGLDINYGQVTQNVTLNAINTTTAVALTTPLLRVFRMKVLANVVAAQNINLKNIGATQTYAIIQAGNNQTLMAIYTVPSGCTAYMTSYFVDGVESLGKEPKSVKAKLLTKDNENGYTFQLKHARASSKGESSIINDFNPYFKISAKSDIKITANPNGEDAEVFAGFNIILVNN